MVAIQREQERHSRFAEPTILPVNDTVVFYSPMQGSSEENTTLVRTGTLAEGSCFYHSMLHACSRQYASASVEKRLELVRSLRSSLAGCMEKDKWKDLGLAARIPFEECVNYFLAEIYDGRQNTLSAVLDKETIKYLDIITELIPLEDGFEKKILPEAYKATQGQSLSECKKAIRKGVILFMGRRKDLEKLSDEKLGFLKKLLLSFISQIVNAAEDRAYDTYVHSLKDVSETVDQQTIGMLSDKFNRDIYFVDGRTRMPYQNASSDDNLRGRKSVIILWVGGNHYEIIGRLVESNYGRTVQREFSPNDPLIRKFKVFLCEPEDVPEMYPELTEYLPKKYRVYNNVEMSEDESSSETDVSITPVRKKQEDEELDYRAPRRYMSDSDNDSVCTEDLEDAY